MKCARFVWPRRTMISVSLVILFFFSGCRRDKAPEGRMTNGYISLSFDDNSVDNWYENIHLLDSLGIRATFYISKFHALSPAQVYKLKSIAQHGHEIAYHSTEHSDLVKTLKRNGMEFVLQKEIFKDLRKMQRAGFDVNNFAYPYGSHNMELNDALMPFFKSLRGVAPKNNNRSCFAAGPGAGQFFRSLPCDQKSWVNNSFIESLVKEAASKHDYVFLYAHQLNNPSYQLSLTKERLFFIADLARRYQLSFVTVQEITR